MVTREDEVGRCEGLFSSRGEVELERDAGERGEKVGAGGCDAGCIVKRCNGAEGNGRESCVGSTRVILCASTDSHVLEDETF